jgi:hypothetical protein
VGSEAAQIAAHNTRDKKVILFPDQILAAHKQIADEFGNQADRVVAEARERRKEQAQERPEQERLQQVRKAVTFARDKGFQREAVVDERALYVDALRRGMGEMTYPEVRASFEARVASGEFKEIADNGARAGRRFTTAATIKAENEIVQKVQDGQSRAPQIMAIESAVPLADSRSYFNAAQKRVVEEVLTSRDRIQGLQGRAGSGKTSVLSLIREGAEKNGYAVQGFAPTSRATKQLAMLESRRTRCSGSSQAEACRPAAILRESISIWSMKAHWHRPDKCVTSLTRSDHKTRYC